MPSFVRTRTVDADGLAVLCADRSDLVIERRVSAPDPGAGPTGHHAWEQDRGPFTRYQRHVDVAPAGDGPDAGYRTEERTEFRLAVPIWAPLLNPLMKRALASPQRTARPRWWWPAEVVAAPTALLVSALAAISLMGGYMGVVIGQTIALASEDFGTGDGLQANVLAALRIGVVVSLFTLPRADRLGRRRIILAFAAIAIVFTALGALAPGMGVLAVTQTVSRGFTTALLTLTVLAATEEVPAGFRAFSVSLMTITAALGAGMVLWVLPADDLVDGGWRVVYLVPLAFLPVLWRMARYLPETRRFTAAATSGAPATIDWRRFSLVATVAFASTVFATPASQLRNEFLRDDLGFSASQVSLFQLVIFAPAGTVVVVAGVLADRLGRRWIGGVGLAVGALFTAASYQYPGAWLWIYGSIGVVISAAAFPAMRGYQTELFPTRSRARVGGLIDVVGTTGSVVGLVAVGVLAERWDDLGAAIGVMVVAPLVVAILIVTRFPETASTELEAFNPGDPDLSGPAPEPAPR